MIAMLTSQAASTNKNFLTQTQKLGKILYAFANLVWPFLYNAALRWPRGSVVKTSEVGWRTFLDIRLIYG